MNSHTLRYIAISKESMNYSFKQLFLIDGIGALVTVVMLSQVLARYEPLFGMPKGVLYVLSGIAFCFAAYSLTCHFLISTHFKIFLKVILSANVVYTFLTIGLVIFYFRTLTWLGLAYFTVELIVIYILVLAEYRKVKTSGN